MFRINHNDAIELEYTPSMFARSSLIHLQETGTLRALFPHKNERSGLASCLFFTVLDGTGRVSYGDDVYELKAGDCLFRWECTPVPEERYRQSGTEYRRLTVIQWRY